LGGVGFNIVTFAKDNLSAPNNLTTRGPRYHVLYQLCFKPLDEKFCESRGLRALDTKL
jgi:hypothetical protein